MSKRINSRRKGAQGERDAAAYLRSLGFGDADRAARNGKKSADDIDCAMLSRVHIECKRRESIDLGTKAFVDACAQAIEDAGGYFHTIGNEPERFVHNPWAVLWRRNRRQWNLTFCAAQPPLIVTVSGDARIKQALLWLNGAQ